METHLHTELMQKQNEKNMTSIENNQPDIPWNSVYNQVLLNHIYL
jgi:hypothetical protein